MPLILYHYIIVRSDLPLGALAAQITHAAGESVIEPVPSGTHAVVLAVPNQAKLLALERKLIDLNIPHAAIREPDEPWNNELMTIGLKPTHKHLVKKVLSNLSLLR